MPTKQTLLKIATDGKTPRALGWKHIVFTPSAHAGSELFIAEAESFEYSDEDPSSLIGLLPNTAWPTRDTFVFEARSITIGDAHGAGMYNAVTLAFFEPRRITIKSFVGNYDQSTYGETEYSELLCMIYYNADGFTGVHTFGLGGSSLCNCLNLAAWCLDLINLYLVNASVPVQVDYHEYLRSDAWKAKRVIALSRADHRCQICNSSVRLNVHHRSYERLGDEYPEDLTVLCETCHKLFHDNGRLAK